MKRKAQKKAKKIYRKLFGHLLVVGCAFSSLYLPLPNEWQIWLKSAWETVLTWSWTHTPVPTHTYIRSPMYAIIRFRCTKVKDEAQWNTNDLSAPQTIDFPTALCPIFLSRFLFFQHSILNKSKRKRAMKNWLQYFGEVGMLFQRHFINCRVDYWLCWV